MKAFQIVAIPLLSLVLLISNTNSAEKVKKNFEYDPADETVRSSLLENPNLYDTDIVAQGDKLWIAWLQFETGKGDHVWIGRRHDGNWAAKHKVTAKPGKYANPTVTIDKIGHVWLSYEAESNKQWDIFLTALQSDDTFTTAKPITSNAGPDINHRTVADPVKGIWIVWQSGQHGQFDILAAHIKTTEKDKTSVVSENSPQGDWHPDLAVTHDGSLHVAWDAYDGKSYNVYARSCKDNNWNDIICVANSPAFEGRVSLAPDNKNNVWISWEQGAENWGTPYRSRIRKYPTRTQRL
ncbi:MAG: hypothetical protein JSV03_15765, partial [Planctomycetota bacterium]